MRKVFLAFAAVLCPLMLACCGSPDRPVIMMNSPIPFELSVKTDAIANKSNETDNKQKSTISQRAVWISYIELAELFAGESCEEDLRRDTDRIFRSLSEMSIDTVYVHVRAFGDAFYRSELFAGTRYLTFDCDPLAVITETAHSNGLSVHAWINPLRCDTEENMKRMEGTRIGEWYKNMDKYPGYILRPENESHYWLDPAVPEVRRLAAEGAAEICRNYDVDGIHIDDYFYPTTDESFDRELYSAYGGDLSLADWRRENCSALVKELYDAVKSVDEKLLFGVSPQGNIANDTDLLYADVGRWCREEGYLDYIVPQIYFGYDDPVCPFSGTVDEWGELACGKPLICGLGMYKTSEGGELSGEEHLGVIGEQIRDVMSDGRYSGFAVYSLSDLTNDSDEREMEERDRAVAVMKSFPADSQ